LYHRSIKREHQLEEDHQLCLEEEHQLCLEGEHPLCLEGEHPLCLEGEHPRCLLVVDFTSSSRKDVVNLYGQRQNRLSLLLTKKDK
jgi:hypothetical protein